MSTYYLAEANTQSEMSNDKVLNNSARHYGLIKLLSNTSELETRDSPASTRNLLWKSFLHRNLAFIE